MRSDCESGNFLAKIGSFYRHWVYINQTGNKGSAHELSLLHCMIFCWHCHSYSLCLSVTKNSHLLPLPCTSISHTQNSCVHQVRFGVSIFAIWYSFPFCALLGAQFWSKLQFFLSPIGSGFGSEKPIWLFGLWLLGCVCFVQRWNGWASS